MGGGVGSSVTFFSSNIFFWKPFRILPWLPDAFWRRSKIFPFFRTGHLSNYECGFEIIFWVALGTIKNGQEFQTKMQEVGNGHALKKGMMPNIQTIDPNGFWAKKIWCWLRFCIKQKDIIPFRPGAPASASAAFSFSHIRSEIVWLYYFKKKCKKPHKKWSKIDLGRGKRQQWRQLKPEKLDCSVIQAKFS